MVTWNELSIWVAKNDKRVVCYFPPDISTTTIKNQSFLGYSFSDRRDVDIEDRKCSRQASYRFTPWRRGASTCWCREDSRVWRRVQIIAAQASAVSVFMFYICFLIGYTSYMCLSVLFAKFVSQALLLVSVRSHDNRDKTSWNFTKYPFNFLVQYLLSSVQCNGLSNNRPSQSFFHLSNTVHIPSRIPAL